MTERDANQLAADLRGFAGGHYYANFPHYAAALDELVALVGTLQQERDAERRWCKHWAERTEAAEAERDDWHRLFIESMEKTVAAEAALAETEAARENWKGLAEDRGAALAEAHADRLRLLDELNDVAGALTEANQRIAELELRNTRLETTERYLVEFDADTMRFAQKLTEIALADVKYVRDGHGFSHMIDGRPAAPALQDIARRALADAGGDTKETRMNQTMPPTKASQCEPAPHSPSHSSPPSP